MPVINHPANECESEARFSLLVESCVSYCVVSTVNDLFYWMFYFSLDDILDVLYSIHLIPCSHIHTHICVHFFSITHFPNQSHAAFTANRSHLEFSVLLVIKVLTFQY